MAATEARLGVWHNKPAFSLADIYPKATADEKFYEHTLAAVDPATGEATAVTGSTDASALVAVVGRYQDDDAFAGGSQNVGPGKTQWVELTHGYLVELNFDGDVSNVSPGDDVYGVDNDTVNTTDTNVFVGRIYQALESNDTVKVYVPGILG